MTLRAWREEIEFALTAPLEKLVDHRLSVAGRLEGDLKKIQPEDVNALERWGLPNSDAIKLRPEIKPTITSFYLIGSSYELGTLDGRRLFVRPQTGRVLDVAEENGIRYQFVNSSIKQFVELAWRYHYVVPVRLWMGENWQQLTPDDEEKAVQEIWKRSVDIDHRIDVDEAVSFWQSRIWGLL